MVEDIVNQEALAWLLEPQDAGVRYLALRDLVGLPADDPELAQARRDAHASGPIAKVLDAMQPEGWWEKPGPGYGPKYRSTVWAMILLGQLGAFISEDGRIQQAANYLLEHSLTYLGQFTCNGKLHGSFICLQGNLCKALMDMGVQDERLELAYRWMARSINGDGIAPASDKKAPVRYYAYQCGPGFVCGSNYGKPCAWGAVKVMAAFGSLPRSQWTSAVQRAVDTGLEFFYSVDPAEAEYPTPFDQKPNSAWWKFGFPVFYITDLLQLVEAALTIANEPDPRLNNALDAIRSHQDGQGRVSNQYSYVGKTLANFSDRLKPSKWVTLRVLRVLKLAAEKHA
jgi:hypothetical protein